MIAAPEARRAVGARLAPGAATSGHRVLGEAPGARLVIDCRFAARDGHRVRAVAKCYAGDAGARTAAVMRAVSGALDPGATLRVPRVLFYDPARGLLAQERATGTTGLALAAPPAMRRIGAAVSELHALPVAAGPPATLDDHLRDLFPLAPAAVAEQAPPLARRIDGVLAALAADPRLRGGPRALVHRDLHLRQLLASGGRIWLLDWDLAATADPALDLGNLVASLRTKLPRARADACAEALLEGYGDEAVAARAGAHEAFTYLRLACKRVRLAAPGRLAEGAALLGRAEEALAR